MEVVFGSDKKATISISKDVSFPAKNSEEREELVKLLKDEGLWGEVEDLDVYTLKKIVTDKVWDENTQEAGRSYREEKDE